MSEFPLYSANEFRRRALNQTGGPVDVSWREHGDHLLNPTSILDVEGMALRDAAVLIPVIDDGDDARVIFTLRTTTLRKHSGQIAFPGGAIDPEDGSPEAPATRGGQGGGPPSGGRGRRSGLPGFLSSRWRGCRIIWRQRVFASRRCWPSSSRAS